MIIYLKGANFSSNHIGTLNTWLIQQSIGSGASSSNTAKTVTKDEQYSTTITIADGYVLGATGITVTMGGNDITSTAVSGLTISIASVTGNVVIRVPTVNTSTGEEEEPDTTNYTFTINPTPVSATVTLSATGYSTVSGTGNQSITVANGTTVSWTVSASGYTTQRGTWTANGSNKAENVVLVASEPDPVTGLTLMRTNSRVEKDSSNNLTYVEDTTYDTYSLPVDENSTYNLNFGNAIVLTESDSDTQAMSDITYSTKFYETFDSSILTSGKAYAGDNVVVGEVMPAEVSSGSNCIAKIPVKQGSRIRVEGHTYLSGVLATLTGEDNIIYKTSKKEVTTSFKQVNYYVEKDGYLYTTAQISDVDDYHVYIETITPFVQIPTSNANTLIISAEKTKTIAKSDLTTQTACWTTELDNQVGSLTTSGMGNRASEPVPVRIGDTVTLTSKTLGNTTPVAILASVDNVCYKRYAYNEAENGLTFTIEQDGILYFNGNIDTEFSAVINFTTTGFTATKQS